MIINKTNIDESDRYQQEIKMSGSGETSDESNDEERTTPTHDQGE